jgi:membrane protein DedA with SNARE-associated domain
MAIADYLWFAPTYGYAFAFIGTLLEGETFLVVSGVAAFRGYLYLLPLYAICAAGAFMSDNLLFAVGRRLGPTVVVRFPRLAPSIARVHGLVERLPNTAVIGIRFFYGMRAVGPMVIGAGTMTWRRFARLDAIAACTWSVCWVSAGFAVGDLAEHVLQALPYAGQGALLLAAGVVGIVVYRSLRGRSGASQGERPGAP